MIYVHVPFCRSFCTYCGFYSEVCPRNASQQVQKRVFGAYADAVLEEIAERRCAVSSLPVAVVPEDVGFADPTLKGPPSYDAEVAKENEQAFICLRPEQQGFSPPDGTVSGTTTPEGCLARVVGAESAITPSSAITSENEACMAPKTTEINAKTLYFGGGTPSVLPADVLERIVMALGPVDYEEFTVEVNPDDIVEKGPEYVARLVAMGVNRISMGVQSFDDGILRWMNRRHDSAEAREAFCILREGGMRNISIDLIFGLSQLSDAQWRESIAEVLALGPEHISAYQLSIEDGSALAKMVAEGKYAEASDEQCRRQYDIMCEALAKAGYRHYEVSNWAKPGFEAVHNSAYWRRVSYLGLGPGAHSFDAEAGIRSWNSEELASYGEDGKLRRWSSSKEILSSTEAAEERIMLALRTAAGISCTELKKLVAALGHDTGIIDELLSEGALACDGDNIRIPEDHFFVSDGIIARMI
ncbi:MAG: coproporphyrinogen-III oxidase family protein [Bacteroidia bacterium]|nr:coproporphyrinogen-III oxidase family protein [Bacteroidia bacterium]